MRSKVVTVWYCGFCKKKSFQRSAMERHEKRCTANPERVCLMCDMAQICQKPISELLSIVAASRYGDNTDGYLSDGCTYRNRLQFSGELRAATEGCPACILATLRQVQPPSEVDIEFDWKKESSDWVREFTRYGGDYR